MKFVITILILLTYSGSYAQTNAQFDSLSIILKKVLQNDQAVREGFVEFFSSHPNDTILIASMIHKMNTQDSINQKIVESIFEKYGWLKKNSLFDSAQEAQFMVVQHAPIEFQLKYLPLVKKAMLAGEVKKGEYAILVDRINMRQGKFQIYGSQINFDQSGNLIIFPILDEPNVDKRRKNVGLPPMRDYVKLFRPQVNYKIPKVDILKSKKVIMGYTKSADKPSNIPFTKIYYQNRLLGQSDSTGLFLIRTSLPILGKIIIFKKNGFKPCKLTVPREDKDVFELTASLTESY
jgi:hypothetical protein